MIDAGVGIGEIFVDKYRVDSILGHGGMGIVALCTHVQLNERVAIKMLRKDVLDDADAVERFMREAQAASKLRSEYVARVSDVGRSGKNVPYMVMEYLDGSDLGHLLDERGSLAVPWAIEMTLQTCEALAEAHSIGIVHRDVKPSNLFVTWRPDGSVLVKVLDFGISKAPVGSNMQLTQTQSLLGTPAYMSPEQMRSARLVDARTDIWSLGTVLYETLEGRRPFEAESFSEMCVKVAVDPPAAMRATPPALQQVVLRCLEKSPEQRYPTMAELARALVPFAQDPHSAQVRFERMARTLERGHSVDWDPMTSGVRRLNSVDRRAQLAAGLASPAAPLPVPPRAHPSGSTPIVPIPMQAAIAPPVIPPLAPPLAQIASGPVAPPLEVRARGSSERMSRTLAIRPRRRGAALVVVGLVAVAALGVTISLSRMQPHHARAPRIEPAPAPRVEPAPVKLAPEVKAAPEVAAPDEPAAKLAAPTAKVPVAEPPARPKPQPVRTPVKHVEPKVEPLRICTEADLTTDSHITERPKCRMP
jgi:serine/threonine-protein kinase